MKITPLERDGSRKLVVISFTLLALLFAQQLTAAPQSSFALTPASAVRASAVDRDGNIYLTGDIAGDTLPVTPNALQQKFTGCSHLPLTVSTCSHSFVAKISADGTRILYATYLGGSTGTDHATAIAVDSAGDAYIAGTTSSTDFPLTARPYQSTPSEGFVTKLNADGSALLGSTYVRGAEPASIAVDAAGNAYITGTTTLMNQFAATSGAVQTTSPGDIDAFVLKLNPTLETAAYSTFLGGGSVDWGYGITVDAEGNAYVAGTTSRDVLFGENLPRFPVTNGAYSHQDEGADAFVSKLSSDGSRLLASTVIGGPQSDIALTILLDSKGDVYVGGMTGSSNFLAYGSVGTTYSFAMKLGADLANLLYSTTLPGRTNIVASSRFQMTLRGDHLIIRHNGEGALSTTPGAVHPCLVARAPASVQFEQSYVLELNATGDAAAYATYARNAYAVTPDFIYELSSDQGGLLEKTSLAVQAAGTVTCIASAATFSEGLIAPGEIVSLFGSGIGPDTAKAVELDGAGKVSTALGGVTVHVNGQPAPLLYVSASQINAVVPFEIAAMSGVSVQVMKDGVPLNTITTADVRTTPGIFAIVNPDGTINDANHRAAPGSTLQIFMTGAGLMEPVAETGSIGNGNTRIAANVSVALRALVAGRAAVVPLDIMYAGDAPGAVQGLVQINARFPNALPELLPTASAFLDFEIGDAGVVSVPLFFTT